MSFVCVCELVVWVRVCVPPPPVVAIKTFSFISLGFTVRGGNPRGISTVPGQSRCTPQTHHQIHASTTRITRSNTPAVSATSMPTDVPTTPMPSHRRLGAENALAAVRYAAMVLQRLPARAPPHLPAAFCRAALCSRARAPPCRCELVGRWVRPARAHSLLPTPALRFL